MTLSELADLCEQAKGPDRELDGAIAKALGLPHGRETGWCNKENGDYWVVDECAKPFTASLDAAITLVPEGHEWQAGVEGSCGNAFTNKGSQFGHDYIAATPALALCAAALRARSAS